MTNTLSRNVGKWSSSEPVSHPRRTKASAGYWFIISIFFF